MPARPSKLLPVRAKNATARRPSHAPSPRFLAGAPARHQHSGGRGRQPTVLPVRRIPGEKLRGHQAWLFLFLRPAGPLLRWDAGHATPEQRPSITAQAGHCSGRYTLTQHQLAAKQTGSTVPTRAQRLPLWFAIAGGAGVSGRPPGPCVLPEGRLPGSDRCQPSARAHPSGLLPAHLWSQGGRAAG